MFKIVLRPFLYVSAFFLVSCNFQNQQKKESNYFNDEANEKPDSFSIQETLKISEKRPDIIKSVKKEHSVNNKSPDHIHPPVSKSSLKTGIKGGTLSSNKRRSLPVIKSSSYYILDALPVDPVKDASVDYTAYIQEAISKYDNLVFPSFPVLINDKGLKIGSNKTLTFLKGSELRLKATSKKAYAILDLKGVSNVEIYNPVIVGDRYKHLGQEGEWGMGISIKGSKNIKVFGAKITDCWGDGIYIGQVDNQITSKNIYIKDAYLYKNRRDGISIISVEGLILDNVYAGYSDGTKPMTGINFEPNNAECELKNIRVLNPRTENNGSRGIQVVNRNMLEDKDKDTDITIINHSDLGSPKNAFKLACNPTAQIKGKMYGYINIVNPNWVRSSINDIPMDVSTNQINYVLTISSPKVTFMNGKVLPYSEILALFMKQSSRAPLKIIKTQP